MKNKEEETSLTRYKDFRPGTTNSVILVQDKERPAQRTDGFASPRNGRGTPAPHSEGSHGFPYGETPSCSDQMQPSLCAGPGPLPAHLVSLIEWGQLDAPCSSAGNPTDPDVPGPDHGALVHLGLYHGIQRGVRGASAWAHHSHEMLWPQFI